MQPVPGYDFIQNINPPVVTDAQLNVLVAVMYVTTALFILQMAVAIHNIWAYLIKQSKYKTLPLL